MKSKILKIITLVFLYSNAYAGSPITVYNDSNLNLYFESDRTGCSGTCINPWTGAGIGNCCGDTAVVIPGKTYSTDPSQSGNINLNDGAPAFTGLGYTYAVWARAQDGRAWLTFTGNWNPGSTVHFPTDFNVYPAATLAAMTPQLPSLTQVSIDTLGSFVNLVNSSSMSFMVKGHPIPTGSSEAALQWQNPSSKFTDLWDTNKNIQITGQLGNLTRTITLSPTAHSLTIQDAISGQNVSPTTTTQMLDLDNLISDYLTPSVILTGWGVSLKLTDQDVQITDVQIYRQYIIGNNIVNDAYWIYPDRVLHGTMDSAGAQPTWKPALGKPMLTRYIHKQ